MMYMFGTDDIRLKCIQDIIPTLLYSNSVGSAGCYHNLLDPLELKIFVLSFNSLFR